MKSKNTILTVICLLSLGVSSGVDSLKISAVYTGEFVQLINGESQDTDAMYLDNIDLTFELNAWHGGTVFLYLLSNNGDDPTEIAGDFQASSNIEANNTSRLYEFWISQVFDDGKIDVLMGLHDLNSEFYTSNGGGLFNNSSFGIGADLSANVPISIFNVTSLGARIKYKLSDRLTVLSAIYDGDPGDPDENDNGTNIKLSNEEGLLTIAEFQYTSNILENTEGPSSIYRFGLWYHTMEFLKINSEFPEYISGNMGAYISIDQQLTGRFSAFLHGGSASEDQSTVPVYFGCGLTGFDFIPFSDEDQFGIGLAAAKIAEFNQYEYALEFIWSIPIGDYIVIKPDFQYVINPGGNDDLDSASLLSLRVEIGV